MPADPTTRVTDAGGRLVQVRSKRPATFDKTTLAAAVNQCANTINPIVYRDGGLSYRIAAASVEGDELVYDLG